MADVGQVDARREAVVVEVEPAKPFANLTLQERPEELGPERFQHQGPELPERR